MIDCGVYDFIFRDGGYAGDCIEDGDDGGGGGGCIDAGGGDSSDDNDRQIYCGGLWYESKTSKSCVRAFGQTKGSKVRSWQDARTECRRHGGDLVKIRDAKMNRFIWDTAMHVPTLQDKEDPFYGESDDPSKS
ncbi:hypothetical protein ElyMa_003115600 [Elysia marginata]|uniref:C-type lectin domain-containing protein n=1 Tax=Elysia marginata TaxID=1093978 RepID=A0AAV4IV28_9GAST|nr:hypothetical protein ElyMa_003115600 [Elysia marginata]